MSEIGLPIPSISQCSKKAKEESQIFGGNESDTNPDLENSSILDDQDANFDELYQSPIKSTQKRKLSQYSEEEQKEIACKNCNASIKKSIFYHFARTKNTSNCQKAYSADEIKYLHTFNEKRKKIKRTEYLQNNKEKILEQNKAYKQENKEKIKKTTKSLQAGEQRKN